MPFILVMAGAWLPATEGPEIALPRSWMLGSERGPCTLRQSDVRRLLGHPDALSASGWLVRWHYRRLGVWFEWECPAVYSSLAFRVAPETMAILCRVAPMRARPLLWLLGAQFTPRESLVGFGWSAWGLEVVLQCD